MQSAELLALGGCGHCTGLNTLYNMILRFMRYLMPWLDYRKHRVMMLVILKDCAVFVPGSWAAERISRLAF